MSNRRAGLALAAAVLTLLAGCASRTGGVAQDIEREARKAYEPSAENEDPSRRIEGVVVTEYRPMHAHEGQRVAYDKAPPYGGAHAPVWADCAGTVYAEPVANENMIHSLEHGAVWIAYDPERVGGRALDGLAAKVDGEPYLMLSPYPGLDRPVSVQSWGHQLKLSRPDDPRIDLFIVALRDNPYTTPEPGGPCTSHPQFDPADPPPFDPSPPGPDAYPVQGP
jgi:Protein of unknown function (DUF3105)